MSDDEKKIIVDEDWKSRVQREKEEARQQAEAARAASVSAAPPSSPVVEDLGGDEDESAPPAPAAPAAEEQQSPGFNDLMSMLASQALYSLGAMPAGEGQQVMVDLEQARFLIELLGVLEEKTRGNLSTEEAANLHEARNEIERIFVVRAQQIQEQAMRRAGVNMDDLRNPPGQGA